MYETVKLITTIAFFALAAICIVTNIMKKKKDQNQNDDNKNA